MKRAKLLLAAIGFFAVVGGAYAFKAKQNQSIFVRTAETTNICEQQVRSRTLVGTTLLGNTYATTIAGALCTEKVDYFQGN